MSRFYSNGKLLLTGEYAVLDGALALALPTKYGQELEVSPFSEALLTWESLNYQGHSWFQAKFALNDFAIETATDITVAQTLQGLLRGIRVQKPEFLTAGEGCKALSRLSFPNDWGLGSSSTLINNLAQWAEVDAYALLWNAFGGSGYDIACAQHNLPILYRKREPKPEVSEVDFKPAFADQLYFVHLNQKQSSKKAIANYAEKEFDKQKLITSVDAITTALLSAEKLKDFSELLESHESLLAQILEVPTVKQRLFEDYPHALKSLGAWGGDFVLAVGDENTPNYFQARGFETVIPYAKMIL